MTITIQELSDEMRKERARCSESCYEAERYCGEAEDIYDELHGKSKEEEEYYKAMEEQYYKDMEEQEERLRQEQMQNYDSERGDVKY